MKEGEEDWMKGGVEVVQSAVATEGRGDLLYCKGRHSTHFQIRLQ